MLALICWSSSAKSQPRIVKQHACVWFPNQIRHEKVVPSFTRQLTGTGHTSVDIWRKWMGPWSKLYHSGLRLCDWASTHLMGPVGMKKRCQKGTPHSPPAYTAE